MAYIEFKDVNKFYPMWETEIKALNKASFEIEKGELVVILGQSGSGKSTCLNILGGMDKVTSGDVIIDGINITKIKEKQLISALLSFVVMYSLAYITISERYKEIATLKVLGYYEREVNGYILKEQLNIVIIGIIIGIIFGSLYANILIKNLNFGQIYLVKQIETVSYLKTAGFIALFALIVSVGIRFMLKKVKMIESLKSIE